jgi:hypothetical protein
MTTHPMHLFDPDLKGPPRKAHATCSSLSNNAERCFSERFTRDARDKECSKETSRVGRGDRFAHCDSRRADHRTLIHDGDDPTGQLQRHSFGGPASCTAPASTTAGTGGCSAHNTYAPEAHLQTRKTNCTGFDSEDGLAG